MSKFTLYRADIDSPRLARVLGKVPGIAVAGQQDAATEPSTADESPPAATEEDEESGGLREKVPDVDTKSAVKTYGLLGLGISMVMLGIATVGVWVYRRRTGGDGEAETPPPSTGEPSPSETPLSATETELSTSELSVVRSEETAEEPAPTEDAKPTEPFGRTEGDRSDVEWTTRERTPPGETATAEETAEPGGAESEEGEAETRPGESVDAAPLLGAAFLVVTGAVVKWLQSGDEA